ncbi:MAG: uroporphyrinogen decarboxylase family protein [Lentisphaeria bacterium]
MNDSLYKRLVAHLDWTVPVDCPDWLLQIKGFEAAGYDYATIELPNFSFSFAEHGQEKTVSWNESCMIMDNEQLVGDIFEAVGSRLVEFYRRVKGHRAVGACISNDDWGFKSQTMLAPRDMRRFVFPWHKNIVETVHESSKAVILHSCGNYRDIIEDVIEAMKFDGRHSYEDTIVPIETAYEELQGRIGVMGGIDVDFICRQAPEEVYKRATAMLERSSARGGYALGSGNSFPEYVPAEGCMALIRAALEFEQ